MRTLKNILNRYSPVRSALWTSLPLSVAVGLSCYFGIANSIEADARERFADHAFNASNTIAARIKSYTDVLRGTASLFQLANPLTGTQFHGYVRGLDLMSNYPALENVNYSTEVQDAERASFEARMRNERDPNGQLLSDFTITPPGRRDSYMVTTFVEPHEKYRATLGHDLYSVHQTSTLFMVLRDNGKIYTTGRPIALISRPDSTVLGVRMPVYKPQAPVATVEQRRAAYVGSVGIAFSVHRLVRGILAEFPVKHVRMVLVDREVGVGKPNGLTLLDSGINAVRPAAGAWPPVTRLSNTLPIAFNGRQWDATFSIDAGEMYSPFEQFAPWFAMLAGFISTMLLYALFHSLTSSRRRAIKLAKGMTRELRDSQAKLQLSHQNLRRLAAHADQIKEGERKRIAREIHDDLGQNLLALRIEADMLSARTGDRHPRLHARARSTLQQIDATIKSVRQIINDLRPNVLDLGLSAAVEWQVAEFERRTGIACELIDEPTEVTLDDQVATAFFRILQESLSNIVRHARASLVRIELAADATRLVMTVTDNGVGLRKGERSKSGSFGLVGIEERITLLGGGCSISSTEGGGTTVCVTAPLHHGGRNERTPGPGSAAGAPLRTPTAVV